MFYLPAKGKEERKQAGGREMKMKKIRQLCIVMLAALMTFSSVGIKAKEQPKTLMTFSSVGIKAKEQPKTPEF